MAKLGYTTTKCNQADSPPRVEYFHPDLQLPIASPERRLLMDSPIGLVNLKEMLEYENRLLSANEVKAAYHEYVGHHLSQDFPKPAPGVKLQKYLQELIILHCLPIETREVDGVLKFQISVPEEAASRASTTRASTSRALFTDEQTSATLATLETPKTPTSELDNGDSSENYPRSTSKSKQVTFNDPCGTVVSTFKNEKRRVSTLKSDMLQKESFKEKPCNRSSIAYDSSPQATDPKEKAKVGKKIPPPIGYSSEERDARDIQEQSTSLGRVRFASTSRSTFEKAQKEREPALFSNALKMVRKDFNVTELPQKLIDFYTKLIEKVGCFHVENVDEVARKFGQERPLNYLKYGCKSKKELLLRIPGFYQPKHSCNNIIFYKRSPRAQKAEPSNYDLVFSHVMNVSDSLKELSKLTGRKFCKDLLTFYKTDLLPLCGEELEYISEGRDENNNQTLKSQLFINKFMFENFKEDVESIIKGQKDKTEVFLNKRKQKLTRDVCVEKYPKFKNVENLADLALQDQPGEKCPLALFNRIFGEAGSKICKNSKEFEKPYEFLAAVRSTVGGDTCSLEELIDCMEGIQLKGESVERCKKEKKISFN